MPDTELLTIRQLADYLLVSEKTVYRMLDRDELPAIRLGAQWRFRKQDIDTWLSDEVSRVRQGHGGAFDTVEESGVAIAPLLGPENVWLQADARSRDELFAFLIAQANLDADVDRDRLLKSILEREAICSTAVLESAAFPLPNDPRPFHFSRKRVLLAVLREPLEFADPQGHRPVIVAPILARSVQGQLLAFSRAIKLFANRELVESLRAARTADEAIRLISEAESRLG